MDKLQKLWNFFGGHFISGNQVKNGVRLWTSSHHRGIFPEMTIPLDTPLVEYTGSMSQLVQGLEKLLLKEKIKYPPEDDLWWNTTEAIEVYQDLLQQLHNQAPKGYFFGGHQQQPQCLGYWKNGIY